MPDLTWTCAIEVSEVACLSSARWFPRFCWKYKNTIRIRSCTRPLELKPSSTAKASAKNSRGDRRPRPRCHDTTGLRGGRSRTLTPVAGGATRLNLFLLQRTLSLSCFLSFSLSFSSKASYRLPSFWTAAPFVIHLKKRVAGRDSLFHTSSTRALIAAQHDVASCQSNQDEDAQLAFHLLPQMQQGPREWSRQFFGS